MLEGVMDTGGWFRVSGVFRFLLCFLSIRTFWLRRSSLLEFRIFSRISRESSSLPDLGPEAWCVCVPTCSHACLSGVSVCLSISVCVYVTAGIKIAGRNINNLRYADDTTPTAESEEEPFWRTFFHQEEPLEESERGEWKSWLKTQHSENEDHGIWSHHFMANRQENNLNSDRLYILGFQNHCRLWLQPWN